jgi:hypothetical protein
MYGVEHMMILSAKLFLDGRVFGDGPVERCLTVLVCDVLQMWIAKSEYDESGPSIVHRKCF